ncbi:MAG: hypothetical protein ACYCTB_11820 [bacterium]
MKKYKAKIILLGHPEKTLEVEGKPIAVKGKEYINLFVYQVSKIEFGDQTCILQDKWHVAEETSGMPISSGLTKQMAISFAIAKLNRYSKEKILEQINKHKFV